MVMTDDLKDKIERLKKEMIDYIRLVHFIELDEIVKNKRIDIYLDDLSELLKQLDENQ